MAAASVAVMTNARKRGASFSEDAPRKRARAADAASPASPAARRSNVEEVTEIPRFCGSRFECYADIKKIGEGTYGTVFSARDQRNDRRVALKQVAWGKSEDGVSASAMREIGLLRELRHAQVVDLEEVVLSQDRQLYMVFEQLDCDLRSLMIEGGALAPATVQDYLRQLLSGLAYCHGQRILHRDLKPQNVLVHKATGRLKIADFGLSRAVMMPARRFTMEVVTLWYRAPEILLGERVYSSAIDLWSLACIFAEMANHRPLFPADSEIDLLFRIFRTLGTPAEEDWPGVTSLPNFQRSFPRWPPQKLSQLAPRLPQSGLALLQSMLGYRPATRITAVEALRHPFLQEDLGAEAGAGAARANEATEGTTTTKGAKAVEVTCH